MVSKNKAGHFQNCSAVIICTIKAQMDRIPNPGMTLINKDFRVGGDVLEPGEETHSGVP